MNYCTYIESYKSPEGVGVSVFHRGNYLYELARAARHVRWFVDMSLEEVREALEGDGFELESKHHVTV